MFPWAQIDTVLLDMDGTLLDLHFDNHFWLTLVPETLSRLRNISTSAAMNMVRDAYEQVEGTLNWYCLDYWAQELQLDIMGMHRSISDKIKLRDDTIPFLDALAEQGKKRILLTNAHPLGLALKLEHTPLASHLDAILSSHQLGVPKESAHFWEQVFELYQLQPQHCLFVDDNEHILQAAKQAGVGYLLGVNNPDSQRPHKQFEQFAATADYLTLLPELTSSKADAGR
ncbi:GMP/IMP nucleotidase [Shewanella avicenniae]|uniref:GMP/IMP nucleotidase n=1 Tax=Shewanella avicenniae TaxID=2814294 RepID=A0ABX7QPV9_9GAMM|nr:GMP/IMP nucleotidase [Shewanella avicenniae]QSX33507.1 GMP/IMP nucleotidase [Shewanella avicenniae]